ncbi:SURF1 family protein [Andreprevotia sp. IGB-42]|uniref:SURF1 family protein n=1 Tax=Andreprevotia sp. IGB-42 TaxID=2497473 RepID=UPI00135BAFD2|nr:SURF1 family protein [Andreprevotia sp. IGB-42]
MSSFMGSLPSSGVIESSHASTAPAAPHGARSKPWLLYALIALTLALGAWQAWRAHYKQTLADAYAVQQGLTPQAWAGGSVADWQRLQPLGHWLAAQTFLLAPRYRNGVPGSEVITPLQLAKGDIVLVNRGWLADGKPQPALPATLPQLETQPWPRFFELGPTPSEGRKLQNLTPERAAALTALAPAVAYTHQISGADDGLLRDWAKPDFKVARHLGYMLTWWACSLCGVLLLRRLSRGKTR